MCRQYSTPPSPRRGEVPFSKMKIFNIDIFFRKNASKYPKLMIEPYAWGNLNQIYRLFFIFSKKDFETIT